MNLTRTRRIVRRILNALGCSEDVEISILLTGDEEIARLNEKYLERTGPTDVMAFPMREGPDAGINTYLLGDVVISTETALRQAEEAGAGVDEEIDNLLIHGILHLFGYDHEKSDEQRIRMEAKHEFLRSLL
jgi:probable rRNA maturation factor